MLKMVLCIYKLMQEGDTEKGVEGEKSIIPYSVAEIWPQSPGCLASLFIVTYFSPCVKPLNWKSLPK